MRKGVVEILLRTEHQRLNNCLHAFFMAGADEDQTERERSKRDNIHRSGLIRDHGNENLLNLLLLAPGVRQAEPHDRTDANR